MVCREGWCSREPAEGQELCGVHAAIRAQVRALVLAQAAALDAEERGESTHGHASRALYNRGCRCFDCVDANRNYMRSYRQSPPAQIVVKPCGTKAAYNRGCRCDECAEANRDYQRQWLRQRAAA